MARELVAVRDANPDDLPDLMALWRELREGSARSDRLVAAPTPEAVLERLHEVQGDPDARLVVATVGEEVAGMAAFVHQPGATLRELPGLHVLYLHVRNGTRRRGAGRALVAAATAFAEECGAEHVIVGVYPWLRDANRFYARLGFGPLTASRVAAVPTLRRKLLADGRHAGLDDLLARRRSERTRTRVRAAVARFPD